MDEITLTAATTAAIMSAAKSAKGLLTSLLGPTADVYGQMIASGAQLRFLENQIKNFEKITQIVVDHGINIKQVNLKVLFPYLNGVAVEEDETLQNLWANLFVNYIDASKNLKETVYPKILADISTRGAEILHVMDSNDGELIIDKIKGIDEEVLNDLVENLPGLIRLGLVVKIPIRDTVRIPQGTTVNSNELINFKINDSKASKFKITDFGDNFLKACSR